MLAGVAQRLKDMEEKGIDDLDTQLFIHIGVGAGMLRCMTYGGDFDKAEFVVAGPALTEAKDCGELAKCGEAIISSSVLKYSMPCEVDLPPALFLCPSCSFVCQPLLCVPACAQLHARLRTLVV